MAFRKESKNKEGSGCNGSSMDTVVQAAARMMKNQVFLCHVSADFCGIFQGRLLLNIYVEKGAHLSTRELWGDGGGRSYLKPWFW